MEKKGKNILKGAFVLIVAAVLVFSTTAVTADTQKPELTLMNEPEPQQLGTVVWDNGMNYDNLLAAQWDSTIQFDAHPADDFHFDEVTEVCDVHWIGGYWNGDPAEFDWCISFYYDDGTGNAPMGTPYSPSYLGPFCFTWEEIEKEELEPGYYEMSVDLPENYIFEACVKYWISIWGVGVVPPQSGWGAHFDPIKLHQCVFGSVYFGFPFWVDGEQVFGEIYDCAFQLTTKEEDPPLICCDPGVMQWYDVVPGSVLDGSFYVWNCGNDALALNWAVDMSSLPSWMVAGGVVFSPASGVIPPGDPGTSVDFQFTAPADPTTLFQGNVTVLNTDDPSNYCLMGTELETPLNSQSINLQQTVFEVLMQRFA
jgi:hypothetical protein